MTSKPSIEILDEFERDRAIAKDRHALELERNLMFPVPGLEGVPFHPKAYISAIMRAVVLVHASPLAGRENRYRVRSELGCVSCPNPALNRTWAKSCAAG